MLPGPLPGGTYQIREGGFAPSWSGDLHTDLLLRRKGLADTTLASGDAPLARTEAGSEEQISLPLTVTATSASCGDELVARVTYVTGGADFYEFTVGIDIP